MSEPTGQKPKRRPTSAETVPFRTREFRGSRYRCLLVTHQPLAALDHATHALFLHEGRVHLAGTPEFLSGDDPVVRSYLHGPDRSGNGA